MGFKKKKKKEKKKKRKRQLFARLLIQGRLERTATNLMHFKPEVT